MRRLFPHPVLSATLTLLWLLLANRWTLGSLILALILATLIPLLTAPWWPDRPKVRHPFGLIGYLLVVIHDVIVASFQVARIILFLPAGQIRSALQETFGLTPRISIDGHTHHVPVVLLYPGVREGATGLSFMGQYRPDTDYRPRIYG